MWILVTFCPPILHVIFRCHFGEDGGRKDVRRPRRGGRDLVSFLAGLSKGSKAPSGRPPAWRGVSKGFGHAAGPLAVGLLVFRSLVSAFLNASPCAGSLASGCRMLGIFTTRSQVYGAHGCHLACLVPLLWRPGVPWDDPRTILGRSWDIGGHKEGPCEVQAWILSIFW